MLFFDLGLHCDCDPRNTFLIKILCPSFESMSLVVVLTSDVVTEFIEGLVETYPDLQYLDGFPEVIDLYTFFVKIVSSIVSDLVNFLVRIRVSCKLAGQGCSSCRCFWSHLQ